MEIANVVVTDIKGNRMEPGGHNQVCLTHFTFIMFLHELLNFSAMPGLYFFPPWQPDNLNSLLWGNLFCQPASFLEMLDSTNLINLAKIFHLYKRDQIKYCLCNLSLYKVFLSLLLRRTLWATTWICLPVATAALK